MKHKHNGLPKSQRLNSHYFIEALFTPGNSRSMTAYPLRLVYRTLDADTDEMLISVPKRQFKHAVDRNHVKRQVREAYRTNKQLLIVPEGQHVHLAFIWLDNKHYPTDVVSAKVQNLLRRATEKINA